MGLAQACQASSFNLADPSCLNFSNGLDLTDPNQQALLQTFVNNVAGGRDYDLERWAIDGRFDIRPKQGTSIILNGGYTNALNSVDFTGLSFRLGLALAGRLQAEDLARVLFRCGLAFA